MKHVHLDTSHLLNGLKAFLPQTPMKEDAFVTDAIDLLSHLICRETIYCDGAVFGKQRDELDRVLDQLEKVLTPDARRILRKKLNEVRFESNDEKPLILAAIGKTSSNAARLQSEVHRLDDQLKLCSAIPSSKDFTDTIGNILLPQLRSKEPLTETDAIFDDKKVNGRRFIWAALKDEQSRNAFNEATVGLAPLEASRLFQFLFTQFRAELAIERNRQIAGEFKLKAGEIFYGPTASRSSILAIALQSAHVSPLREQKGLEKQIESAWFKRPEGEGSDRPYLPLAINFVLSKAGAGIAGKLDLLNLGLELSESPEVQKLRRSLDSLTMSFVGHHNRAEFLGMLKEDVCLVQHYKSEVLPWGSIKEVLLLLSLAALPILGPKGLFGVASAGVVYCNWRFRTTRINATRLAEILPLELNEQHYCDRFRSIFGRTPPTN